MRLRMALSALLGTVVLVSLGTIPGAQAPSRSVSDGAFTAEQAIRGQAVFAERCAVCHGEAGIGDEVMMTPAVVGEKFIAGWKDKTLGDLFALIRDTMPQNEPGILTPQQYADVLAHVLNLNKLPAGDAELPADGEALKQIRF